VITEAFTPRLRLLKLLLFSALLLAGGAWLLRDVTDLRQRVGGILGVALGGVGVLYFGVRLLFRAAVLRVDLVGITERSSLASPGHIRWDEIDSVKIYTVTFRDMHGRAIKRRMLGVYPRPGSTSVSWANPVRRLLMRVNGRFVEAPVNIAESVLPFTLEDLVGRMRQFCPTLQVRS
jgi:hypothetical protein